MAEIEVPWDDAGRGGIAVVGDLKESSSPVHKKQRSDEKDELEFYDEDIRQINLQADRLVYTEKDHALDSIISILNHYYPDGCNDENDVWFKYWRQLVDSEGFDIDPIPYHDTTKLPIPCHDARNLAFVPLLELENYPGIHESIIKQAKLAIEHHNQKKDTDYEFAKVEKANARFWGPICANFYITFLAKDPYAACGLTTFQALVWEGAEPDEYYVKFCRPKVVAN